MSYEVEQNGTEKSAGFQQLDHYERLIKLREESPDAFMLRTSEATRRALHWYEQAKAKRGVKMSEKKDESIYDKIRREVKEREAKEQERQDAAQRFMHKEPSPGMKELKERFNQ